MSVHTIRLLGPWQVAWTSVVEASDFTPPVTVKVPFEWGQVFGNHPGHVRLTRRFHRPTNLGPEERVWLVFHGLGGTAHISLNGRTLGTITPPARTARYDITHNLSSRNELTVDLQCDPLTDSHPAGLFDLVTLTIVSSESP